MAIVLSFVLSTAVSLYSLNSVTEDNKKQLVMLAAARIHDTIRGRLQEPIMVSHAMAGDVFLIDAFRYEGERSEAENIAAFSRYLEKLRSSLGYETAFVVSSNSRRYYTYKGLNKIVDPDHDDHDVWYSMFLAMKRPVDLIVDTDEVNGKDWTVFVNHRVEDANGRLLGVAGVGVKMTNFQGVFDEYQQKYGVKINLIDENGVIQADTDTEKLTSAKLDQVKLAKDSPDEYLYQMTPDDQIVVTKYIENQDWYLVVQSDAHLGFAQYSGILLRNGIVCLIALLLVLAASRMTVQRMNRLINESIRDKLTRLYNRRAYEDDLETLRRERSEAVFAYIMADINNLKQCNDTYGHAAGDELIQGAAACLRTVFSPYGRVYRIGGDEFAALIHATPEALAEAQKEFKHCVENWRGKLAEELSISIGYASRDEFPDATTAELSSVADTRMYKEKVAYKQRSQKQEQDS